jgi:catechol 2,3-dioxygenase-like lactoylglutathione lyase family enzyme
MAQAAADIFLNQFIAILQYINILNSLNSSVMKNTKTRFHAGLHVSNLENSIDFYSQLFDSQPVKIKSDYAKFETDQIVLSLILRPGAVHPGFGHFGLRVESDAQLRAYHNRMKAAGHTCREEEKVDCCYAVQDKFWVKDPDGFDWEVYTFIEDSHESIRPEAATASRVSACC